MEKHVVIVGWDDFSRGVARQLRAAKNEVAVVTSDRDAREDIRESLGEEGVAICYSPMSDFETLADIDIEASSKVFVNLESDEANLIAILNLKELYDGLEFDVVLNNRELEDTFYVAGVTYAVSKEQVASRIVASHMFEPEVGRFNRDLIEASPNPDECDMVQFLVTEDCELAGSAWGDAMERLRGDYGCLPVGLSRPVDDGTRELDKLPSPDTTIEPDDYLLLILRRGSIPDMEGLFGVEEGIDPAEV